MLSKEQRKTAIAGYKERKTRAGIYAVRCEAGGQVWVGSSRNVDAAHNSIWFSLRIGAHRGKALQDAWRAHGETAFAYEVLETLADDAAPLLVSDLLKEARQQWIGRLGAKPLL